MQDICQIIYPIRIKLKLSIEEYVMCEHIGFNRNYLYKTNNDLNLHLSERLGFSISKVKKLITKLVTKGMLIRGDEFSNKLSNVESMLVTVSNIWIMERHQVCHNETIILPSVNKVKDSDLIDFNSLARFNKKESLNYSINGIYGLYHDNKLIYIGKSSCIKTRLKAHRNKFFTSFSFVEVPKELLSSYERAYINKYLPCLNIDEETVIFKNN